MARTARIKDEFGRYYIKQHGGHSRCLFQTDADRLRFADILNACQAKYGFLLHGYCLSSDNTYELVVDVNGGDISKIMKSINISYAMYTKCEGQLFKDRFKSELIASDEDLSKIKLKFKHRQNHLEGSQFTVCFDNTQSTPKELTSFYFEDCQNCIRSFDLAKDKLQTITTDRGLSIDELLRDKPLRNELIRLFRKHSTLSLKQLGQLFGNLSESTISKLLK